MKQSHSINKSQLIFGIITALLGSLGNGIILPVVPFLVQPYVLDPSKQAMVIALLTTSYALCQLFASPILGALSDSLGRRPVLLLCLLGSALGYFLFGVGGALWVLFLGRILDGITGGNMGTLFAYFADITSEKERTKYFGMLGAISGIGFILGPVIGGLMARYSYSAPMFLGASITLISFIYGFFFMKESLPKENRKKKITITILNPYPELKKLFSIKQLRWILVAIFLYGIPFASLQANFSLFVKDSFSWDPAAIGVLFFLIGIQDIITQGLILQKLISKYGERKVSFIGLAAEFAGYSLIVFSALFISIPILVVGTLIFGFGDALLGTALNGMASQSAESDEQGILQGGMQSVQALTRIIGPLIGGEMYIMLGHHSPYIMGVILVAISAAALLNTRKTSISIDLAS